MERAERGRQEKKPLTIRLTACEPQLGGNSLDGKGKFTECLHFERHPQAGTVDVYANQVSTRGVIQDDSFGNSPAPPTGLLRQVDVERGRAHQARHPRQAGRRPSQEARPRRLTAPEESPLEGGLAPSIPSAVTGRRVPNASSVTCHLGPSAPSLAPLHGATARAVPRSLSRRLFLHLVLKPRDDRPGDSPCLAPLNFLHNVHP